MSTVWIVSLTLAWVVIALLTAVVVRLVRQVAELRTAGAAAPARAAVDAGPRLYDEVRPVALPLLGGGSVVVGGEQERPAVLVFHSPGCASCDGLEDAIDAVAAARPDVVFVSVVGLKRRAAREHLRSRAGGSAESDAAAAVAASDVPRALVPDALPALLAIAREGLVAAVGAPESARHLREAADVAAGAVLIGGPDSMRELDWVYAVPAWDAPPIDIARFEPPERGA